MPARAGWRSCSRRPLPAPTCRPGGTPGVRAYLWRHSRPRTTGFLPRAAIAWMLPGCAQAAADAAVDERRGADGFPGPGEGAEDLLFRLACVRVVAGEDAGDGRPLGHLVTD